MKPMNKGLKGLDRWCYSILRRDLGSTPSRSIFEFNPIEQEQILNLMIEMMHELAMKRKAETF